MKRRAFVARGGLAAAGLAVGPLAHATQSWATGTGVVRAWNDALINAIQATATDATISARMHSMLHEAIYNAWAAYDPAASFTLGGLRKRPWYERSSTTKVLAIGRAALGVLTNLLPTQEQAFRTTLTRTTAGLGSLYASAAQAAGDAAASALLAMRHADGANQLGNLAPGAYADYTGYQPVNGPDQVVDPTRWQPLRITNLQGQVVVQRFLTPHWGRVRPFALPSGSALRPALGQPQPTWAELDEIVALSAALDDRRKVIIDRWAANPGNSFSPPGQWSEIAQRVSQADGNSLDADVKLFFAVGQALLDASIAVWDAKRAYDSVRPITAIRHYYRDVWIRAWSGPGRQPPAAMPGATWNPYQRFIRPSPPFAEFPSGHSAFSAAASTTIAALRGSDVFALSDTLRAGDIGFDVSVPAVPVTLTHATLSSAAAEAAFSRRLGGIHFIRGDLASRTLGKQVGDLVVARCRRLFAGG